MKKYEINYTVAGDRGSLTRTETIRAENTKNAEVALIEEKYGFSDCPEWNAFAKEIRTRLTINSVERIE